MGRTATISNRARKWRAELDRRAALMRANGGRLPTEPPTKNERLGPLKIRPGKSLVGLTIPERIDDSGIQRCPECGFNIAAVSLAAHRWFSHGIILPAPS